MKHADIYITHNMTNMNAGHAAYVYVISADTSRGEATCGRFGTGQDVTVNRINLLALKAALQHFRSPAEITVYTDSSVMAGAFNCNDIRKWRTNDFKTARGKPLANEDLWRSVADLTQKHLVNAILTKHHQYSNWADEELKKKYGTAQ